MTASPAELVEQALARELARGDAVIASTRPVLHHLLVNDANGLLNEEIVARLRGMLGNVAFQLLLAQARSAGVDQPEEYALVRQEDFVAALCEDGALLTFAHSQALEVQLATRLQARSAIDPVLTPLVQELVGSQDPAQAQLAMAFLASQARYIQQQQRMELPLRELPGDLFHRALMLTLACAGSDGEAAEQAVDGLRKDFEESQSRLGLISRLVMSLGRQAKRALAIDHAGLAIFATALSMASEQARELAVLSLRDTQSARLALALRSAGLEHKLVEEQLLFFMPDCPLPKGFETLQSGRAAALLAGSAAAAY